MSAKPTSSRCLQCDQPMLPEGEARESPGDFRHARGCPAAPAEERRLWPTIEKLVGEWADGSHDDEDAAADAASEPAPAVSPMTNPFRGGGG